eukprot:TRINITY_DN19774_c0_g2_i1.p1 TRINITY_DN19774_c0_g2~~TRINITY_DN19774_c0_g2_i1.p1  ORF type:complete len:639 (+),score=117.60 TRINITY_DN19774_c0_g2_i1:130-1917(+)
MYNDLPGSSSCSPCPFGTSASSLGSPECPFCDIGKFGNETGLTSCYSCPPGKWNLIIGSSSGDCSVCAAGYYQYNSSCLSCSGGYYSKPQDATCTQCPPGKFASFNGSSSCFACVPGTFANSSGMTKCNVCAPGWISSESATSCTICGTGKFSNSTGSVCLDCSAGKWSNIEGLDYSHECQNCPPFDGVTCYSGSTIPLVGAGFWREVQHPGLVYICMPSSSCQEAGYGNTTCSEEYTGSICSSCKVEYFRLSGFCVKCVPKVARVIIFVCFFCFIIIVAHKFLNSSGNRFPMSVRVMLFWFQFLALLPALSNTWPTLLSAVLSIMSLANFDIGYVGFGCDITSYFALSAMKLSLPPLFLVVSLFLKRSERSGAYSKLLVICNLFALTLMSTMLQIFNCFDSGNGRFVVFREPSIECYSPAWRNQAVFHSFMILLYMGVLPMSFAFIAFKIKKSQGLAAFLGFVRPIVGKYRDGAEWFELVKLFFKFGIVVIRDALSISSGIKIPILSFVMMVMWLIELRVRPYARQKQQDLSLLWNLVSQILLLSNIMFVSATFGSIEKTAFSVILVIFIFASVMVSLSSITRRRQTTEKPLAE